VLKISPATSATNVPGAFKGKDGKYKTNDYILYPDSEDANTYYAMAEFPTFHHDSEGNPNINLIWYWGGDNKLSAGICTMTIALPVPDMDRDDVKKAICKALKKDIANPPHIKAIDFKSGSVVVQAFENDNAYQRTVANAEGAAAPRVSTGKLTTTPSLVNSNAAVVTFNLDELGVQLFWGGLGGPEFKAGQPAPEAGVAAGGASVISATYNVEFDGLLPGATATVTLNKKVTAKLSVESKKPFWGSRYNQATGSSYDDVVKEAIVIEIPATNQPEVDKVAKTTVQKLLTDWGAAQLESMVRSQMPTVALEKLDATTAQKIETLKDMSASYKLSQAIGIPKHPQGMLPKIDGLATQKDLARFFQTINLTSKPFFDVDFTLAPPSEKALRDKGVARFVITQLTYCDGNLENDLQKPVSTLEFVVPATEPPAGTGAIQSKKFTGKFDINKTKSLEYSYLVAYTDETPPYQSGKFTKRAPEDNINYLALAGVDLGVLSVKLNGIRLPWDVISNATVNLACGSWKKEITIPKDAASNYQVSVVQAFGEAMEGKKLKYQVTLNLANDQPIVGPELDVVLNKQGSATDIALDSGKLSNQDITFELGDTVKTADFRLEYTLKGGGAAPRVFKTLARLDQTKKTFTWKVPCWADTASQFKITQKKVVLEDGKAVKDYDLSKYGDFEVTESVTITVAKDKLKDLFDE
jgi:hypothetical protein